MVNPTKYFPEGVALDNAFINRNVERKLLASRIKAHQHSVLMAPRRYGKTSLVIKIADEMKIPYCAIDFLAAYHEEYVRDLIVDKVSRLVFALLPNIKKGTEKLLTIFNRMKPEVSIGAFGQRLSLSLSKSPLNDITQLLLKLDETAQQFNKQAVIFMDEFQQLSQIKSYHSIEASIRHAVERSKNIAYVFSGSNRQLLRQMFGDQGRPLYRLCQVINIERMAESCYTSHLQHLAKLKWKKELSTDTLEKIFFYTELHPFYVNVLCQTIWEQSHLPTLNEVTTIWHNYVKTQRQIISHDIMELSVNQRKLITALAKNSIKEIQSIEFIGPLKISASSAQQALEVLTNKDLVYRNSNNFYCLLDPAMKYYLNVILWEMV